jgi:hypothetical protein
MNRVVTSLFLGLMLLVMGGCKHVANSEIVAKYHAAGGGDPDGATAQQIGVWMSQKDHEGVRKELAPLCLARQKTAPADWMNSDEGRICTGVMQASMFAPATISHGSGATF